MKMVIEKSTIKEVISAPASKSIFHRALVLQAFAGGKILGPEGELSADVRATQKCLEILENCGPDSVEALMAPPVLPCNESGTTLRFLIPVALLRGTPVIFTGAKRLFERPLSVYEDLCRKNGFLWQYLASDRLMVCGKLQGGQFEIPGDISSQFVSGLLMVLPLLAEESEIHLVGAVESRSYIEMTRYVMQAYGVVVEWVDECTLHIPGGQQYTPCDFVVEGDYSNAANLDALRYVGHQVEVQGLNPDSVQGDRIYPELFEILKLAKPGEYPVIDVADCPDLGPVLMALAAEFQGAHLIHTRRLKWKESDRGTVMALELKKFGAEVQVLENEIWVKGGMLHTPDEILDGHGDHRIVMALAVLCTRYGGEIEGAEAVNKSFPDFFEKIKVRF